MRGRRFRLRNELQGKSILSEVLRPACYLARASDRPQHVLIPDALANAAKSENYYLECRIMHKKY